MTTLRAQVTIDATAAAVWDVVAHRFDHVGDWATVIPASHPAPGESRVCGGPVAGRVCTTGLGAVAEVTERIVTYDEAGAHPDLRGRGTPSGSEVTAMIVRAYQESLDALRRFVEHGTNWNEG